MVGWEWFLTNAHMLDSDINVIAVFNTGYCDLAANWYVSAENVGLKPVLVALSDDAADEIDSRFNISRVLEHRSGIFSEVPTDAQVYYKNQWRNVVMNKIEFVSYCLRADKTVLLSDVDLVFLRNPVSRMLEVLGDADIVMQTNVKRGKMIQYNSGFYLATPRALPVFSLNFNPLDFKGDQKILNRRLKSDECTVSHTRLDKFEFPVRKHYRPDKNPYIVHMNFCEGKETKLNLLMDGGFWYIESPRSHDMGAHS